MKKNNQGFTLVVLFIVFVIGAVLILRKSENPKFPSSTVSTATLTSSPLPIPSPVVADSKDGLKILSWDGFSVNFPATWRESDWTNSDNPHDPNIYLFSPEKYGSGPEPLMYYVFINRMENPKNLSFKESVTANLSPDMIKEFSYTQTKLNGYSLYKTENLPSRVGCLFTFVTNDSFKFIELTLCPYDSKQPFGQQNRYVDILNQILSTFKFIN